MFCAERGSRCAHAGGDDPRHRLRAAAHRRSRGRQSRCSITFSQDSSASRVPAGARGTRKDDPAFAALPHRRSSTTRSGRSAGVRTPSPYELEIALDAPVSADPLLVRDAVHGAGAVGGGRSTTTARRGATAFRRARRRHRALPHRALREAQPRSCSNATRALVRVAAASRMARAGRDLSERGRAGRRRRRVCSTPRVVGQRAALRRPHRAAPREGEHPRLHQVPAGLLRLLGDPARRASTRRWSNGDALAEHARRTACRSRATVTPSASTTSASTWTIQSSACRTASAPQAAPGDEPRDRPRASSCALFLNGRGMPPKSPCRRALRLRRALPNPFRSAGSRARAQAARRGRLRERHRSRDRPAAAAHLRHRRHVNAQARCATSSSSTRGASSGSTSRSPRRATTSSRTRCAAAPTSSIFWGWSGRLPGSRELPVPALGPDGRSAVRRTRAQHLELLRTALRRALRRRCAIATTTPSGWRDHRRRCATLLEHERPWIELFHQAEDYALIQGWLRNVKPTGARRCRSGSTTTSIPAARAGAASRGTSRCAGRPRAAASRSCWRRCPASRTFLRERQ